MAFTQGAEKVLHEIVANIIESERQQQQKQSEPIEPDQESDASNTNTENTVELAQPSTGKIPPVGSFKNVNDGPQMASSHNSSSTNSIATMTGHGVGADGAHSEIINRRTVADYLDRKLETLMREWHNSTDLLYSIHPLDGSLLVW